VPERFERLRVFPVRCSDGTRRKFLTDWGYDSTVLRATRKLLESETRRLLYDSLLFLRNESGRDHGGEVRPWPARFRTFGPNSFSLAFDPVPDDCIALVSFMYYGGWRARTPAGDSRDCFADESGVMAVRLRRGDAGLALDFRPLSLRVGCTVAMLTLVGLLGVAWICRVRSRR